MLSFWLNLWPWKGPIGYFGRSETQFLPGYPLEHLLHGRHGFPIEHPALCLSTCCSYMSSIRSSSTFSCWHLRSSSLFWLIRTEIISSLASGAAAGGGENLRRLPIFVVVRLSRKPYLNIEWRTVRKANFLSQWMVGLRNRVATTTGLDKTSKVLEVRTMSWLKPVLFLDGAP